MLKNIQKIWLKIILKNEYYEENVEEFIKQIDNLKINIDSENYCAKIKYCFCDFISTGYSMKSYSKLEENGYYPIFHKHILTHMRNIKNKNIKKIIILVLYFHL